MFYKRFFFISFAALFSAAAQAQVKDTGHGYLFRYKYVPGRRYNYAITSSVAVPKSGTTTVTGPLAMLVAGVKGGNGSLAVSFGPLVSGTQTVLNKMTYRYVQGPLGNVIGNTHVQQMSVQFPQAPKRPGDSWTGQTSAAAMGSNSVETAHYKFIGMVHKDGRVLAKLALSLSSKGQADTRGTGTVLVSADDGSLYSTQTNLTMSSPNTSSAAIHISMLMTRRP